MKLNIQVTSANKLVELFQKGDYKRLSKKIIFFFLSIAFVSVTNGQALKNVKLKTEKAVVEKTIKENQKTVVVKDSVKKIKIVAEEKEIIADSLLLETGDFKFYKKAAHASYYAMKFHGKKTASGKKYDMNKYTAAHKKLPFGTKVKITNEANGKSVIVEITDRGPFVRAREIDLSKRAFMDIANNKASGAMIVTMEVLKN